ncbi:hypothetical protein [Allokutzneria oryzae]|uniref:DUF3558 domain-containing protein n=1 Tax=Allokutzneria oryzae TaxID=1378989 RepID=A0ABV5ZZZ7_9PSEU
MSSKAFRLVLLLALSAVSASSLSGCGLFGRSWDVRFEVRGPGEATVKSRFAGDNDKVETASNTTLPWTKSRSVGFGFNDLWVEGGKPGTVCKVFVDDKLVGEKKVDDKGNATCRANNQDPE